MQHAKKRFETTESIIVGVKIDGTWGYGEACPRPYVTGETMESVIEVYKNIAPTILKGIDIQSPIDAYGNLESRLIGNYAAKAGVDLAIHDAVGKLTHKPVSAMYGDPVIESITLDGGIPMMERHKIVGWVERFFSQGVKTFKLKAGSNIEDTTSILSLLTDVYGDSISFKVDANSVWTHRNAIDNTRVISKYNVLLLEDPSARVEVLKKLRQETSIPLMADETLLSYNDAVLFADAGLYQWFNVRISKNGGIGSTTAIVDFARERDIKVQLGTQYAETGILDAARRHLASFATHISRFEGGGSLNLHQDIVEENMKFGDDLKVPLRPFMKPGLGVTIRKEYSFEVEGHAT